jgi:hypothetical protein
VTLTYSLGHESAVDLYLEAADGRRFHLRRAEPRPAGRDYHYLFDGSYPLFDRDFERRVLPDGTYRVVLEAADVGGVLQAAPTHISIHGADTRAPTITDLAAHPSIISPNFDGLDDGAAVSYRLDKRAQVSHHLADQQGRRASVGQPVTREAGEYRAIWDGLDARQVPLPDGEYRFGVRAADAAGNVSLSEVPIQVAAGGRPEARLIEVSFHPPHLASGGLLQVQATVRNTGNTTLRTQGPEPGFTYSSYDTYAGVLERRFVDRAGVWRVGVDWAGSPGGSASKYPYRWGFGRDLSPGEEVTVEGFIRVEHGRLQDRGLGTPNNRLYFYAALIQENIAFFDDKVGGTWIELEY